MTLKFSFLIINVNTRKQMQYFLSFTYACFNVHGLFRHNSNLLRVTLFYPHTFIVSFWKFLTTNITTAVHVSTTLKRERVLTASHFCSLWHKTDHVNLVYCIMYLLVMFLTMTRNSCISKRGNLGHDFTDTSLYPWCLGIGMKGGGGMRDGKEIKGKWKKWTKINTWIGESLSGGSLYTDYHSKP